MHRGTRLRRGRALRYPVVVRGPLGDLGRDLWAARAGEAVVVGLLLIARDERDVGGHRIRQRFTQWRQPGEVDVAAEGSRRDRSGDRVEQLQNRVSGITRDGGTGPRYDGGGVVDRRDVLVLVADPGHLVGLVAGPLPALEAVSANRCGRGRGQRAATGAAHPRDPGGVDHHARTCLQHSLIRLRLAVGVTVVGHPGVARQDHRCEGVEVVRDRGTADPEDTRPRAGRARVGGELPGKPVGVAGRAAGGGVQAGIGAVDQDRALLRVADLRGQADVLQRRRFGERHRIGERIDAAVVGGGQGETGDLDVAVAGLDHQDDAGREDQRQHDDDGREDEGQRSSVPWRTAGGGECSRRRSRRTGRVIRHREAPMSPDRSSVSGPGSTVGKRSAASRRPPGRNSPERTTGR